MQLRQLGQTALRISPVALGCWPISGMTSLDVTEQASLATVAAALDAGINHFDTAYCYGAHGESEMLVARALGSRRDEAVIATKGGIHWDDAGQRVQDASPKRLRFECEESLRRLATDSVELLYLHAPDPNTPIADSAGALRRLMEEGKTLAVGVSNASVEQLETFAKECPIAAVQPPYNMLQRQAEERLIPWCVERGISTIIYWPLMKGLLAGKLPRDIQFDSRDGRAKYPMFQGDEWRKNQDFVDRLRTVAADAGKTVAQTVVNWTIRQTGVTAALCGAKRPDQIVETAGALDWRLSSEQLAAIDQALADRGQPALGRAV
jgi:aryl-alcohol dehydrogenase-like predicted oxidoreductase